MPSILTLRMAQYLRASTTVTGTGALSGGAGSISASGTAIPPDITGTADIQGGAGAISASGAAGDIVGSGALTGGAGSIAASGIYALPGLVALWDANQIAGNDGDAVGTFADTSGNGHDLTQATTSAKPTLRKGANGFNGQNVIELDSGDSMATGSFLDSSFDTSMTVYLVMQRTSGSSSIRVFTTTTNKLQVTISGSQGTRGSKTGSYRGYTPTGSALLWAPTMTSSPAVQNIATGAANGETIAASWVYNGTNAIAQANGIENDMFGAGTAASGAQGLTGSVTIGGTGIVGKIAYLAFYNAAHSTAMRNAEELRLRQLYGVTPSPAIWCIGDSTTAGVGATNEAGYWPSQMVSQLSVGPFEVMNRGVSGSTVAQWIVPSTGYLATQVTSWLTSDRSGDYAVLFIGGNDADARGGAAIWGDIASMISTLKNTYHMTVFVCTIAPRNNHNYSATGSNLNPTIVSSWRSAGAAGLIDLTQDTAFDSIPDIATDIANATYYSDAPAGVHFTDAGYLKIATMVANGLNAYVPSSGRRTGRLRLPSLSRLRL